MAPNVKSWLVKDFPVELREKINAAAYEAHVTVPVWLVNYFNTYGIGGEVIDVKPGRAKQRKDPAEGDLNALLHASAAVLSATGGKGVPGLKALVGERGREARGLPERKPRPAKVKAIAAPEPELTSAKHSEITDEGDANPMPADPREPTMAAE